MSLHWIIGLLALWSVVITTGNVTTARGVGTATSNEISAFIISIKITNRVYNDSLEDHQSQSYKILRQDVENVFFEMYKFAPSVQYEEIAEMTFSNGSVVANSTVLFRTKLKSGQTVKNIFVTNYQQHSSPKLDLNINYTADHEPVPVPLSPHIPNSIFSLNKTTVMPNIPTDSATTMREQPNNIPPSNISTIPTSTEAVHPSNISTIPTSTEAVHPSNISTIPTSTEAVHPSHFSTIPTSTEAVHPSNMSTIPTSTEAVHPSNMSTIPTSTEAVHPSNISTIPTSTEAVHPSNISTIPTSTAAVHPSNISTIATSTEAVHPSNISTIPTSTAAVHPSNISTIATSTEAVHPSNISTIATSTEAVHPSNVSAMSASSSPLNPGKTATQESKRPEGLGTGATEQGVPSWGIAILVLAAIILFFMLVLLILLLLFWCCWWRQRGFMSVSDPDPTGYYNPDIPMYSTHSTYDSHNGKSLINP